MYVGIWKRIILKWDILSDFQTWNIAYQVLGHKMWKIDNIAREKTNNRCIDQNGVEDCDDKKLDSLWCEIFIFGIWLIILLIREDDISIIFFYIFFFFCFFIGQYLFSCKWLQLALKDVHALASIICNDVEYSVPITWRIDNTDTHL